VTDDKYIFEASWEVCNKVGGIYTVVRSKAQLLTKRYPNYFLIGPYKKASADVEFVTDILPHGFGEVFEELKKEGIVCYFGHWLAKGNPKVILIDFSGYWPKMDSIKKDLWDNFKVDSLNSGFEFNEVVLWASAVGKLVEKFVLTQSWRGTGGKCIMHAHEWIAGAAILHLKMKKIKIATIFTTHATMLGRTIAGNGRNLYDELDTLNPEQEARNYGIIDKFSMERAVAKECDVFTTVSEITGIEAEKLLGRKPDILVLNGLDSDTLPTYEEAAIKHARNRHKLHEFMRYYFLPYYYFDVDNTILLFIVGRYEFKNKGIDITIDALGRLNDLLKKEKEFDKNIVCFFWIPRDVQGVRQEISMNKTAFTTLHEFVEDNIHDIKTNVVSNIIRIGAEKMNNQNICENILPEDMISRIKRMGVNFAKRGNPPLSTHNISYEDQDAIVSNCRRVGLTNRAEDKVKIVFYPIYLSGVDGLTDMSYYDGMNACHLGLFPSYYEPWGYTPLECGSLGVPSLTSDLSGFGKFLEKQTTATSGIYVLKRHGRSYEESLVDYTNILYNFSKLSKSERVQQKILAKELSLLADWKVLIENYYKAHTLAVQKAYGSE
jgi:glycogen(starch) synthase